VAPRRLDEIVRLDEHAPRPPQQRPPGGRHEDAPRFALEQPDAERALDLVDPGGEGGLRHPAFLGRAAEAPRLRDGEGYWSWRRVTG
jgi:hypothetical protein